VTVLLDANVLIALLVGDHVHHAVAENWFSDMDDTFATCPVTQGSLMRLVVREGQSAGAARTLLSQALANPRHEFWPDDVAYTQVPMAGIIGHRQLTDAYLAQLARARGARVATFDQAMARLHTDVADLIPDG
jgi:uncharacterized protein